MEYLITIKDKTGKQLFMVNRSITKKKWWTLDLYEAMFFILESSANIQCRKLSFNNPEVVTSKEAFVMDQENLLVPTNRTFSERAIYASI